MKARLEASQREQSPEAGGRIGIVIIGRNEGERLAQAFSSIPLGQLAVLYVDSGSTDGSVELARSLGVEVHRLDPARPFSPARARAEGVPRLISFAPYVQFIQFLDGDCKLTPNWLEKAAAYLEGHEETAIVCGGLTEAAPEASVYNRLGPQRWRPPLGEIESCGGIFMIQRQAYEAVGGFNPALITREERDLCARIRGAGYRIVRLDTLMAQHDSGLHTFREWWTRAVWGGYGDALGISSDLGNIENRRRLRWYLTGSLATSILIICGLVGLFWSPLFAVALLGGLFAQGLQFLRIAVARMRQRDPAWDAAQFAAFSVLRSFACGLGFFQYLLSRGKGRKRPDPHALQEERTQ